MNSIFGRINTNNKAIDQSIFNKSIERLNVLTSAKQESLVLNFWGLGQIKFPPFDNFTLQDQDLKIVSDSAIYNKSELADKLNLQETTSDDFIILESFKKWGSDCLNYLIGDFAFAIWDVNKKELFCARDHFGVKPFNYYFKDDCFVFSSDASAIIDQMDLSFSLDEQFIADSISIIKSEQSKSTYNEIKKLPPAHYLHLKNNQLEVKKYWQLSPQTEIKKSNEEIIQEFKLLLIEAVRCRTEGIIAMGSELSGGIDSSSVTAIANQFTKIKTFSHILPDYKLGKIHPFSDERKYANLVTDFCKINDQNFIRSEEILLVEALNQHIADFKGLSQQNFGIFSDHLYKSAMQEDISVLLSGFGGDEVVTSKSPGYLNELAKNKRWKELRDDLGNQNKKGKFIKYYIKDKIPFITKLYSRIKREKPWWQSKLENLAINKDFFEILNIKENYFSYHQKQEGRSSQEKIIDRITHPHVAQRLEYCALIARKYGVEYRYPLLDKRLIEYYLAIPLRLKAREGIGRYIIRKAINGIIPKEIQWRNDKSGATIPTVYMRMLNDKEKIRKIINRAKSNQLITKYIDFEKYEKWFENLCKRSERTQKNINPGAFYNYLKLILFIEQNPNLFE